MDDSSHKIPIFNIIEYVVFDWNKVVLHNFFIIKETL